MLFIYPRRICEMSFYKAFKFYHIIDESQWLTIALYLLLTHAMQPAMKCHERII